MTVLSRLKEFLVECRRVLRITKKPSTEEFRQIVKVSGLGILLIGLLGFLITMTKQIIVR